MKSTTQLCATIAPLCNDEIADLILVEIEGRERSEQQEYIRRVVAAVAMVAAWEIEQELSRINVRERAQGLVS